MEVAYQLIFYKDALKDIHYWKKSGNKQAITKIDKNFGSLREKSIQP